MQPTADGYIHQSRLDDAFEEYEAFVQSAFLALVLTTLKRDLTNEETHLLQRSAELTAGYDGNYRGADIQG